MKPSSGDFAAIETLFHEALELPPERRPAFLDAGSAGHAERRAAVEALLRGHALADDRFLAPPGIAPAAALTGRTIGRYRIERVIATGGMGTVYAAVQEAPHRTVALKVLRSAFDSPEAIR